MMHKTIDLDTLMLYNQGPKRSKLIINLNYLEMKLQEVNIQELEERFEMSVAAEAASIEIDTVIIVL